MGHMIAAAVIEVDGQQDSLLIRRKLQHELLFALNPDDSVGIPENVRTEPDFQAVLVPIRFGFVGGVCWVRFA
jgi:hypothetical protein